jgi:hypothetical protein
MKTSAPSDTAPDLEDRLGPLEPPYTSRAHVRIGRMLDQYGVLLYYRQPRLVLTQGQHEIWHPAFTLPYYNSLVIEYAGPVDTPEQRADLVRRQQVYQDNGSTVTVFAYWIGRLCPIL